MRTLVLTGLSVAKSGTIDISAYTTDRIKTLLSFIVVRPSGAGSKETKTVINSGEYTSTVPSNDSVALSNATTIVIGNDNSDSLTGVETVLIKYTPKAVFLVPT